MLEFVHEALVWLGKIKCAAKALACVSACSSFKFAKGWIFTCRLSVSSMSVVSSATLAPNVLRLGVVANLHHKC